jgi:hypothetical protein
MQAQGTKTGNARRRLLTYCTLTCVSVRINGEVDLEQFPIVKNLKGGRSNMMNEDFERDEEANPSKNTGVLAYCDHCGFAIYSASDALVITANGDRIHRDCWSEYEEEHMFEFAKSAEDSERFDCGY